jgi:ABC-type thiamine transport system ATPase subunit
MLAVERLKVGSLSSCNLALDSGLHVILARETDGTPDFIDVLSGSAAPSFGRVRISARDPYRSPDVRRRISSLRAREESFPQRTVSAAVATALSARGLRLSADDALRSLGLESWSDRDPRQLSAAEHRSVAACVAFSSDEPLLAVLHEPLAYLPGIDQERVQSRLRRWLERAVPVLCTTSSPRTAHALGGTIWLVSRGQLARQIAATEPWDFAPGSDVTLLVRSESPRELLRALAIDPAVSAVALDELVRPSEIRVQGRDAAAIALAIARAGLQSGVAITAIAPVLPDLEFTHAASEGYLRGAYDAAYQAALHPQLAEARTQ